MREVFGILELLERRWLARRSIRRGVAVVISQIWLADSFADCRGALVSRGFTVKCWPLAANTKDVSLFFFTLFLFVSEFQVALLTVAVGTGSVKVPGQIVVA